MKTEELRKLDAGKMNEALIAKKKHLFKISFDIQNGQAKNIHEIKVTKKQIARIKTVMKEKEKIPSKSAEVQV